MLKLGLLDSESNVLTTRPWNHYSSIIFMYHTGCINCQTYNKYSRRFQEVPPRLELQLLDSEFNVLTTRPWNNIIHHIVMPIYHHHGSNWLGKQ
mgnify:CR=1 FL=1